jgi:hypothetical protein
VTLVAWILMASVAVTDVQGHRPTKGIPQDGAEAISGVCAPKGEAVQMCAAVYVVQAFRESGYRLDAIGDGGRSHGPYQTAQVPHSWKEAVAQFTPILIKSATTCAEPLALLASGSCTNKAGIAISRARMAEAKRLVAEVEWKP